MRDYRIKVNTKWLERKRDSLLKRLAKVKPFVDGSIVKVRRRCGNKNCKCAKSTYRPESYYLHYKVKGVTRAVYIPVDMEEDVRRWQEEYRWLKGLIKEICKTQKAIIRRHVREKRRKKARG